MVTQHEGAAAYGRFELGLTVLSIGALAVRLGLDGVMVKWLASARAQGLVAIQRKVAGRAVMMVLVPVEELLLEKCHEEESHYDRC